MSRIKGGSIVCDRGGVSGMSGAQAMVIGECWGLARGEAPEFLLKNRGVLVPQRAILAIQRPTKLMSNFPETAVIW